MFFITSISRGPVNVKIHFQEIKCVSSGPGFQNFTDQNVFYQSKIESNTNKCN